MTSARLNFTQYKWDIYAVGYKDAADILVNSLLDGKRLVDNLVYPIIFLYRHYIEIRLKEITMSGNQLLNLTADFKDGHVLAEKWRDCREVIKKIFITDSKEHLNNFESLLFEYSKIDSGSDSFRYPVTTLRKNTNKRDATLPGVKRIDVLHFKNVVGRMGNLLENISNAIGEFQNEQTKLEDVN